MLQKQRTQTSIIFFCFHRIFPKTCQKLKTDRFFSTSSHRFKSSNDFDDGDDDDDDDDSNSDFNRFLLLPRTGGTFENFRCEIFLQRSVELKKKLQMNKKLPPVAFSFYRLLFRFTFGPVGQKGEVYRRGRVQQLQQQQQSQK